VKPLIVALALAAAMPLDVHAQVRPVRPPVSPPPRTVTRDTLVRRDSLTRRDSLRRVDSLRLADTSHVDTTTVKWAEPDSVARALMARPDYEVTRFQGSRATYDARSKDLRLDADSAQRAAVERNGQLAVSDSAIFYNQSTSETTNLGHYIINLPGSTEAPIRGVGRYSYNASERFGRFTNAKLPFSNGETWYLDIRAGAVKLDPVKAGEKTPATIYIEGLKSTSCPDSIPDYYFKVKSAKRTTSNTIIGRDVTLVIGDVPVLWLPFIFQNVHGGRSSGMLTTRFGISDIIRNSPSYHRNIENLGYYWVFNDYMDAAAWLDWRSGAGGSNPNDPGYLKTNFDYQYNWLNRFLGGNIGGDYWAMGDGSSKLGLRLSHGQRFSHEGNLQLNLNYSSNTTIQQRNSFDPVATLATISSQAQYSRRFGPATFSLGGTRTQYPGRPQIDQAFPNLTISSAPINFGEHVTWTPSFSYSASQSLHIDQPGLFGQRFFTDSITQTIDSAAVKKSSYKSSMSIGTPLKIFGQEFGNSFSVSSDRFKFPELFTIHDVQTGDSVDSRIYGETYQTAVDWTPTFQMPSIGQNRFNLAPIITLANVDPGPFWVSSERTNGKFVSQSKRLAYGLSASPTLYARFPGFGPFSTFRHSISPTIGYTYAPAGHISDEYLAALGRWRKGYLGSITQNAINFGLNTTLEAKVAARGDSMAEGNKLKVLTVNMSPFSYNISRLHAPEITNKAWWAGLTTERFNYSLSSELLPGIEFSSDYSLFQGSTTSDTAVFKPYREGMSASLTLSRDQNLWAVLTKLFGRSVPVAQHAPVAPVDPNITPAQEAQARELVAQPSAGTRTAGERFLVPPSQGWKLNLRLSSSRPRPPVGGNVIDFNPEAQCASFANINQFVFDRCVRDARLSSGSREPITSTTQGGTVYRIPGQTNVSGDLAFNLTPRWTASWNTNYDFVRHEFAMHQVGLQRDLHDWRANFNFTQSSNGNFAFSFSIGLKAQPDLKFDYARNSIRSGQP
jgi:hypothetical protein